jgi:hypothetical protein
VSIDIRVHENNPLEGKDRIHIGDDHYLLVAEDSGSDNTFHPCRMAEILPLVGLRMVEALLLDISDTRSIRSEQVKTRIEAFVERMDAAGER